MAGYEGKWIFWETKMSELLRKVITNNFKV